MIFWMDLVTSNGCNFSAIAGSSEVWYFMTSPDTVTTKAKASYKSRVIAAIWTRISALCLLYTIVFQEYAVSP